MTERRREFDCDSVQQYLFELRDGTLEPACSEQVREHLAHCERCRAARAWDSRLTQALRDEAGPVCPVSALAGAHQALRSNRRRMLAVRFGMAAAIMLGFALGFWRPWKTAPEDPSVANVPEQPTVAAQVDDLSDLAVLAEPPPVDSLDVLARQQNGYVSFLRRIGED